MFRWFFNLFKSSEISGHEEDMLLLSMSNWQRNQWQRAGSPMDKESLQKFAKLSKREVAAGLQ